jgi:hypothetical protein
MLTFDKHNFQRFFKNILLYLPLAKVLRFLKQTIAKETNPITPDVMKTLTKKQPRPSLNTNLIAVIWSL